MGTLTPSLFLVIAAVSSSDIEVRAGQHVTQEFERVGRNAPAKDPSLARAAQTLARKALDTSAAEAVEVGSVSEAIASAEGYDPGPRATIVRGSPPDHALASFLARKDLNLEPASHVGVGAAIKGEQAAVVVLLTQRKAELKRFPRTVAKKGTTAELCGELLPPFRSPSAYVTRPTGKVEKVGLSLDRGSRFCVRIGFPSAGRYWLEVMGQGRQGPEVAALFPVDVGASARPDSRLPQSEPTSVVDAQRAIVERINAVRAIYGVPPLQADPTLNGVAQSYAERMGKENFFAHVGPDGSDLQSRLQRAGYPYRAAAENLGLAGGPIAAHFSIERSPGHRRNLIEGAYTRVGVGVAFVNRSGRAQVLLAEVFATPARSAQQRR